MLTIPNAVKDAEQLEISRIAMVGIQSGTATTENGSVVYLKSEAYTYHMAQVFIQEKRRYTPTQNLYTGVYSSLIHNCQKTGNNSNVFNW